MAQRTTTATEPEINGPTATRLTEAETGTLFCQRGHHRIGHVGSFEPVPGGDPGSGHIPVHKRWLKFDHYNRKWKMLPFFCNQVDICRECGRTRPESPFKYGDKAFGEHLQGGIPRERLANVFYTCTHCVSWPPQLPQRYHVVRGPSLCGVQCETFVAAESRNVPMALMSTPNDPVGGRTRVVCALGHMTSGAEMDLTSNFERCSRFRREALRGHECDDWMPTTADVVSPTIRIDKFVRAEPRRPQLWSPRFVLRDGVLLDLADAHHIDDVPVALPFHPKAVMSAVDMDGARGALQYNNKLCLHVPPTVSPYDGWDRSYSPTLLQWPDEPMFVIPKGQVMNDFSPFVGAVMATGQTRGLLLIRIFYVHETAAQRVARDVLGRFAQKYCLGGCSVRQVHKRLDPPAAKSLRPTTDLDMNFGYCVFGAQNGENAACIEDVADCEVANMYVEDCEFDETTDCTSSEDNGAALLSQTQDGLNISPMPSCQMKALRLIWDLPFLNVSHRTLYKSTEDWVIEWFVSQGTSRPPLPLRDPLGDSRLLYVCKKCRRTHPETGNRFPEDQQAPSTWLCGWCRKLPPELGERYHIVRTSEHCSVRMAAFHVQGGSEFKSGKGAVGADPRGRLQILHATYGEVHELHRDVTQSAQRAHQYQREQFGSTGMFDFRRGIGEWIEDPSVRGDKLLRLWYIYESPVQRIACHVLVRNLRIWYYAPGGPLCERLAARFAVSARFTTVSGVGAGQLTEEKM